LPRYRGERWYDVAQICRDGHVLNDKSKALPEHNQRRCDKCGSEVIDACPQCNTAIRGQFHNPNSRFVMPPIAAPAFCHECGKPYPWTESKLDAARELVGQLEILDIPEKTLLNASIEELVRDTPKAPAAAIRFRSLVSNVEPLALEGLKQILFNVLSDPVRKMVFPAV
jgi:hypothetical protein